jgi:hypothetical protein
LFGCVRYAFLKGFFLTIAPDITLSGKSSEGNHFWSRPGIFCLEKKKKKKTFHLPANGNWNFTGFVIVGIIQHSGHSCWKVEDSEIEGRAKGTQFQPKSATLMLLVPSTNRFLADRSPWTIFDSAK